MQAAFRTRCAVLILSAVLPSLVLAAAAPTIVNVTMQDTSTPNSLGNMTLIIEPNTIKAGQVTFQATNQSKNLIHEAIVVKVDPKNQSLPYNEKKAEVIESRIHHLGEISDLKPGASGKLTLKLAAGSYLLVCNQPGHYKAGMSAPFTVTK